MKTIQLTRLTTLTLYKLTKTQTADGDFTETLTSAGVYSVAKQELTDNVSATIYGADINKMLRISSTNNFLELLLKDKLNNKEDNISKYRVSFGYNEYYKIVDVKSKYIDIERL